jgi:hypothetical protein
MFARTDGGPRFLCSHAFDPTYSSSHDFNDFITWAFPYLLKLSVLEPSCPVWMNGYSKGKELTSSIHNFCFLNGNNCLEPNVPKKNGWEGLPIFSFVISLFIIRRYIVKHYRRKRIYLKELIHLIMN